MRSRQPKRKPKPTPSPVDAVARLGVQDLDRRVTQLESRLRVALTVVRAEQAQGAGKAGPPKRVSRRPRCPGCTLELPKGRRGEVCVWCGFRFDAVKGLLR